MLRSFRTLLAAVALAGFVVAPSSALAGTKVDSFEARGVNPVVDILLMRPLGAVMLLGSVGLFVPAAAITAMTRPSELDVPYSLLVEKPVQFVFRDPLGQH